MIFGPRIPKAGRNATVAIFTNNLNRQLLPTITHRVNYYVDGSRRWSVVVVLLKFSWCFRELAVTYVRVKTDKAIQL